jgi:hypothetical protein
MSDDLEALRNLKDNIERTMPTAEPSDRYTMAIIDLEQNELNIKGHRYFKLKEFLSSLEIDNKKYIQVHDFTSQQTINDLNYHYLSTCPPSELLWFLDNVVALLKQRIVKLEMPTEEILPKFSEKQTADNNNGKPTDN